MRKSKIFTMQSLSPNFIIRVPKKDESEKREKIGHIYLHPSFVWMTRNTQCGVIESISNEAQKQFPNAKIGDILLCHHFVQASHSVKEYRKRYLVNEDNDNFYYKVTAQEYNGDNNQSYGIWDGEKIIPHKDYVFLEKELVQLDTPKQESNIELTDYKQTNDDVYQKLENIKSYIMNLTKTKMTDEIKREILSKEKEQSELSKKMQERRFIPCKIAYSNSSLGIDNGTTVYALNIAVQTTIEFNGIEYRVCSPKYISATV